MASIKTPLFPHHPTSHSLLHHACPSSLKPRPLFSTPIFSATAVFTEGGVSLPASFSKPRHRPKKADPESDSIAALHELIRPDHGTREASPPLRPAMEAERYIQMVKVQQQRGLQRFEGDQMRVGGITLRPGDYVVH